MNRTQALATAMLLLTGLSYQAAAEPRSAMRGERMYRACVACHSLEPNRNMTGPSLAEIWNRKAGSLASFPRYSAALKSSGIIWTDDTLDEWVKDPQHFIPGNTMTFPGMKDARQRADLLAFLKEATQPGRAPKTAQGGMMISGGAAPNLKTLDPQERVRSITHCGNTYKVATADGKVRDFWERNLRFKTDVSDEGPQKGAPATAPETGHPAAFPCCNQRLQAEVGVVLSLGEGNATTQFYQRNSWFSGYVAAGGTRSAAATSRRVMALNSGALRLSLQPESQVLRT